MVRRAVLLFLLVTVPLLGLFGIDVDLTVPIVRPEGLLEQAALAAGIDFQEEISVPLRDLAADVESDIENDPEVQRFSSPSLLNQGFANSGAAASHLGTPRAFADFRSFAFVLGTGVAVSAPGVQPSVLEDAASEIETEGDIYVGAAVQPVTAALGINVNRWLRKTRVYVKFGYFDIPYGTIADEVAFNSLSLGLGATYQLVETRQLPLGFLRWRGISLGSGLLFQRNQTDIDIQVTDEAFTSQAVTYGDVFDPSFDYGPWPFNATDEIGTVEVSPSLTAAIESRTYSIPLEVSTGLRILWLLDVNIGAGIDVVFGSSDLELGAGAEVEFVPDPAASPYVSSVPGSASLNISSSEGPQFARPRVTGGAGLNLGPVKLDVPLMLYFDSEGNTLMAGVNLAIVW